MNALLEQIRHLLYTPPTPRGWWDLLVLLDPIREEQVSAALYAADLLGQTRSLWAPLANTFNATWFSAPHPSGCPWAESFARALGIHGLHRPFIRTPVVHTSKGVRPSLIVSSTPVTCGQWQEQFDDPLGDCGYRSGPPSHLPPAMLSRQRRLTPVLSRGLMPVLSYCNALSKADGLTSVYSLERGRAQDGEEQAPHLVFDATASGWRLPTFWEWCLLWDAGVENRPQPPREDLRRLHTFAERRTPASEGPPRPGTVLDKPPNAWGLYDTLGNVRQVCWMFNQAAAVLGDCRIPLSPALRVGVMGTSFKRPLDGVTPVDRLQDFVGVGESFWEHPWHALGFDPWAPPTALLGDIGFRVVREDVAPQTPPAP